jgi:hypothetical protein
MGQRPRTWQQAERRALVADLVRTQAILQARSEQLREIFASRWYRLARFSWRLRRGRIFRKASPPAMAGEDSFVRSLNGDAPAGKAAEVRLVPSPGGGVAVDLERERWRGGARLPALEELRVAAILDRELEACLAPDCDLDTGFGPGDWRERLAARPPHLLLVESAWEGNGGGWTAAVAPHPGSPQAGLPALRELAAWCRERGIPTAFWATRDPLGFDRFAAAAALCDHVFTVDADRLAAYQRLPGVAAGAVSVLPPAVQPRLHNPIAGAGGRDPAPAFAGACGRGWPGERRRQLEELLDGARPLGLTIYECAPGALEGEDEGEDGFPERFLPHIVGRLAYGETAAAYKRHRVFLSAGPAPGSPTAVPRQVFEQLACGATVLSAPGAGVETVFGELVPVASGREAAAEQLARLLGDEAARRELAARGQRHVLAAHTYRDRLAELTAVLGFDLAAGEAEETAVLLACGGGEPFPGEAVGSLLRQSVAPNEVLLGLAGEPPGEGGLDRLAARFPGARIRSISQDGGAPRSARLRELARVAAAPWVAPLAPAGRYGPHHLRDLIACTRFAEAQVIGLGPAGQDGDGAGAGAGGNAGAGAGKDAGEPPHRYVEAVAVDSALAARELVAARGWPDDEAAMRAWFAQGVRIYAGAGDGGAAGDAGAAGGG